MWGRQGNVRIRAPFITVTILGLCVLAGGVLALTPDEEIVKAKEEWHLANEKGDLERMKAAAERAALARAAGGTIPATATLEDARSFLKAKTSQGVVLKEHSIEGAEAGSRLYLREKRLAGVDNCAPKAVLLLHPYGVPTAMAFDVTGYSWMDDLAKRGFDVWAMDFRGFGQSTRPLAMEQPAGENPPVVRATDMVRDVDAAIRYIQNRCGVERVDLIGWSWGAVVAGMYSSEYPDRVGKLVLYGAMHGFNLPWMAKQFENPNAPGEINPKLPAYQVVGVPALKGHWDMMIGKVVGPSKGKVRSQEALDVVSKVFLASDPQISSKKGQIRRPMGPLVDLYYIWTDRPIYDASRIQAPTLLIRGDRDEFADPTFIDRLIGVSKRREVIVGDATHWLLYEEHRDQLLEEVGVFLAD